MVDFINELISFFTTATFFYLFLREKDRVLEEYKKGLNSGYALGLKSLSRALSGIKEDVEKEGHNNGDQDEYRGVSS